MMLLEMVDTDGNTVVLNAHELEAASQITDTEGVAWTAVILTSGSVTLKMSCEYFWGQLKAGVSSAGKPSAG